MQRRKFLIGMGSLAVGTGAVFGTSANNNFNVNDRSMSVNVVADGGSGVIGLLDRTSGDIVNTNGNKELEIDFVEYGASEGVPKDAVIELGETGNPIRNAIPSNSYSSSLGENAAFGVANYAAGQNLEFEFSFTAGSGFNINDNGSEMYIRYRTAGNGDKGTAIVADETASAGDTLFTKSISDQMSPGEAIEFAVVVNTGGEETSGTDGSEVSLNENLSGQLSFSATQV
jgi:hypothetical protein